MLDSRNAQAGFLMLDVPICSASKFASWAMAAARSCSVIMPVMSSSFMTGRDPICTRKRAGVHRERVSSTVSTWPPTTDGAVNSNPSPGCPGRTKSLEEATDQRPHQECTDRRQPQHGRLIDTNPPTPLLDGQVVHGRTVWALNLAPWGLRSQIRAGSDEHEQEEGTL